MTPGQAVGTVLILAMAALLIYTAATWAADKYRGAINLNDLTTDGSEAREWHDTPLFAETVAAMGHDTPAAQFARRVEEAT